MGIKQLNNFLLENCTSNAIYKTSLKYFANRTIVIDTSIYLYKFAEKFAVAENIYLMISVFRQYNIVPVFIFDGKPPSEKKALLIKRKMEKDAAELKYNEMKVAIEMGEPVDGDVLYEMEKLKKQFIRISESDISKSKEIMRAYGVPYIESKGESDQLCAFLVKHGFAWACLSDDMDMFLYGCPRVIRHLSLLNHEGVYYDTSQILSDLDMTPEVFNDIAILSGTDYNLDDTRTLSDTLRLYMRFREYTSSIPKKYSSKLKTFYEWLIENTDYIQNIDSLLHIRNLFDLSNYLETNRNEFKMVIDIMPFQLREINLELLKHSLEEHGFIFI